MHAEYVRQFLWVRKITRSSFVTSLSQSVHSIWGTVDQSIRRNAPEDFNLHEKWHWRVLIEFVHSAHISVNILTDSMQQNLS
jgi:hypothetical protein